MSSSRRVAIALAASACLATGALVAAFAAGVSLDLSRWRDAAAQQASVALGATGHPARRAAVVAGTAAAVANRRPAHREPAGVQRRAIRDRRRGHDPHRPHRRAARRAQAARCRGRRRRPAARAGQRWTRQLELLLGAGTGLTALGNRRRADRAAPARRPLSRPALGDPPLARTGRAVRQRRAERPSAPGAAWPGGQPSSVRAQVRRRNPASSAAGQRTLAVQARVGVVCRPAACAGHARCAPRRSPVSPQRRRRRSGPGRSPARCQLAAAWRRDACSGSVVATGDEVALTELQGMFGEADVLGAADVVLRG